MVEIPHVEFVLNGVRRTLTRGEVERRLEGVAPEPVHKHAVRVGGTWFPVRQAFERALGVQRSQFISHTARRHLATLGFETAGEIERRSPATRNSSTEEHWHREAEVQAAVVAHLIEAGWQIDSTANTDAREHGIDIIASTPGTTVGIEVKGYPSTAYVDPARANEVKPTRPSTQAKHWFAAAVLAAMRTRSKHPDWTSAIALPDFARFRTLYAETETCLAACAIEVWWVTSDGQVLVGPG